MQMVARGATYDGHYVKAHWVPILLDAGVPADWFPPDVLTEPLQTRQERVEAVRSAITIHICTDVCIMIATYINFQ
jgi:hypothetical protein